MRPPRPLLGVDPFVRMSLAENGRGRPDCHQIWPRVPSELPQPSPGSSAAGPALLRADCRGACLLDTGVWDDSETGDSVAATPERPAACTSNSAGTHAS